MTGHPEPSELEVVEAIKMMLRFIGEDPDRPGLVDTPERVLRSWSTLFGGYRQSVEELFERSFEGEGYDQMILVGPVEYWSTCEHHLLPFFGKVFIGYIPNKDGRVVGLSKLARVVEVFARRLQIQENLTKEIADAVERYSGARGVAVLVKGKHLCMVARGVQKQSSWMTTSALRGVLLENPAAREEFFKLTENGHG